MWDLELWIVFILWEMTTKVLVWLKSWILSISSDSVTLSSAFVASSSKRISRWWKNARANEILCLWPPDIFEPYFPSTVFIPSGNWLTKTFNRAFCSACWICLSWLLSKLGSSVMLVAISASRIKSSCGRYAICDRQWSRSSWIGWPLKNISPLVGGLKFGLARV